MAKKTVVEESPFEVEEVVQTEGQNLLDEGFAQIEDEMINGVEGALVEDISDNQDGDGAATAWVDDGTHKCDTCLDDFATCESKLVTFGIDVYPEAEGKEANRVVACGTYQPALVAHVCNIELGPEFTRFLPTPVPDNILADYARDMARLHSLWVKTKLNAKVFAKACKEVTDNCEDQEIKLAEIVGSGTEETEVAVRWSFDFTQNIKRLIRQDTMEVVEEAPMTTEDRQGDLFGRTQESIENVQNCLEEGAGLEAGDDISPEQDTQEPQEGENALETISGASDEIGGNDGVSFPTQEEFDKDWPLPGPQA